MTLLAQALSARLRIPALTDALVKTRATEPQKKMPVQAQKRANVAGAFAVKGDVDGKQVILVDDLYDSGATVAEAARVLAGAGAASLVVLTLTKTIRRDNLSGKTVAQAHWLALALLPGIGPVTARKLLHHFGDVAAVFAASIEELEQIPQITRALAEQLLVTPIERLETELLSLGDEGINLLTWDDERFPGYLRALPDAPLVLFTRGSLLSSDSLAVAIVGTRAPSPDSIEVARALGRELAARGLTIVSGLAPGVDTAAHRGAVESAAGRTLAVLGSGIRFVHPRDNAELAERIAGRGALLSELHPNTPPRGPQLMARDRMVSGLSRAVIVVEAAENSGSLDTAAKAQKQGRLLYAISGSAGTEQLLAAGARVIKPGSPNFDALAAEIAAHSLPDESDSVLRRPSAW